MLDFGGRVIFSDFDTSLVKPMSPISSFHTCEGGVESVGETLETTHVVSVRPRMPLSI